MSNYSKLEKLIDNLSADITLNIDVKALDEAKELLAKQTPLKPIELERDYYLCPSCEGKLAFCDERKAWHEVFQPYCMSCGQKLDWE